jgi:hypothetical protein
MSRHYVRMKMISRAFSEPGYETKQRTPLCTSRISCRPNEERRSVSAAAQAVPSMLDDRIAPYVSASRALVHNTPNKNKIFHSGVFPVVHLRSVGARVRQRGNAPACWTTGLRHMTPPFVPCSTTHHPPADDDRKNSVKSIVFVDVGARVRQRGNAPACWATGLRRMTPPVVPCSTAHQQQNIFTREFFLSSAGGASEREL